MPGIRGNRGLIGAGRNGLLLSARWLLVAPGGGGATGDLAPLNGRGGSGGGGECKEGSGFSPAHGSVWTIVLGQGGVGPVVAPRVGGDATNSSVTNLVSCRGGHGGQLALGASIGVGGASGSGFGGSVLGYGGGAASAAAGNSPGSGLLSNITGTFVEYGRGGGTGSGGGGGAGGDGGVPNTGSFGGKPSVFIVAYSGPVGALGGVVTTFKDLTIHTFTDSGTFTFTVL